MRNFFFSYAVKLTGIRVDDLISKYSTQENKENFIAEVKKINKIDNLENIDKKSLIIPVIKHE